jgi:hypothetical protein
MSDKIPYLSFTQLQRFSKFLSFNWRQILVAHKLLFECIRLFVAKSYLATFAFVRLTVPLLLGGVQVWIDHHQPVIGVEVCDCYLC